VARNNHIFVLGDITSDIYYDNSRSSECSRGKSRLILRPRAWSAIGVAGFASFSSFW
jgi:hypothetical protein